MIFFIIGLKLNIENTKMDLIEETAKLMSNLEWRKRVRQKKQKRREELETVEVEEESVKERLLRYVYANGIIPYPNTFCTGTLYMFKNTFLDIIGNTRWELNRPLDEAHIESLYRSYELEIMNGKDISFFSHIDIAYVKRGNYIRVIDGQHRMEALREIRLRYRERTFYIPVVIWDVETELDMMRLLHLTNHKKAFDMNLIKYDEASLISEMEKKFLSGRFKSIFGKKYPQIDKLKFIRKIGDKIESWKLRYGEICNLVRRIDEINDYVKNNINEAWGNSTIVIEKAVRMGFYLGLDREMGWVDMIYKN